MSNLKKASTDIKNRTLLDRNVVSDSFKDPPPQIICSLPSSREVIDLDQAIIRPHDYRFLGFSNLESFVCKEI